MTKDQTERLIKVLERIADKLETSTYGTIDNPANNPHVTMFGQKVYDPRQALYLKPDGRIG